MSEFRRLHFSPEFLHRLVPDITQTVTLIKTTGADITLRVIDDLSHTYPREENDGILKWFDPGLALPE